MRARQKWLRQLKSAIIAIRGVGAPAAGAIVRELSRIYPGTYYRRDDLVALAFANDLVKRLELARDLIGAQDPLDLLRSCKTPVGTYVPLSMRASRPEGKRKRKTDEIGDLRYRIPHIALLPG